MSESNSNFESYSQVYKQFVTDVRENGGEWFHYRGRNFYEGPATIVRLPGFEKTFTDVPCLYDQFGVGGWLAYPSVKEGDFRRPTPWAVVVTHAPLTNLSPDVHVYGSEAEAREGINTLIEQAFLAQKGYVLEDTSLEEVLADPFGWLDCEFDAVEVSMDSSLALRRKKE